MNLLVTLGEQAKTASKTISQATKKEKNDALFAMAQGLREHTQEILQANKKDVEKATDNGMPKTLLDRLTLDEDRVESMAEGLEGVATLDDPIGIVKRMWTADSGIQIGQQTVPLGVVGMIYEARPNVTADAAGLSFKAGNAVILRGGKEAFESNKAIVKALQNALAKTKFPEQTIQLIEDTTREVSTQFMQLNRYLDVLIPRGGAGLINAVMQNATVPVIETGTGNVHVYIDSSAPKQMAVDIAVNSKTDRPSVCNAAETLLIHEDAAEDILPAIGKELARQNVELRVDGKAKNYLADTKDVTEEDYETEFLDMMMAVKVVSSIDEAIEHINHYSTKHSEAIVTQDYFAGRQFQQEVDAAAVYVNASTRFTDGFEFGFGAEIGISTQKIHARGPMGLEALTSTKYIINGEGQIK